MLYIDHTIGQSKHLTGSNQIYASIGWNIANNALYVYPHISDPNINSTQEIKRLDSLVGIFFQDNAEISKSVSPLNGPYYIESFYSPLRNYLLTYLFSHDNINEQAAWCRVAPAFYEYGKTLTFKHPGNYIIHYSLPNTLNYLYPPLRNNALYNYGQKHVLPEVQRWFKYKTTSVSCSNPTLQGKILQYYSPFFLMINIALIAIVILIIRNKSTCTRADKNLFIFTISIYVCTLLSSLFLSPFSISGLIFPLTLYTCVVLIAFNLYNDHATALTISRRNFHYPQTSEQTN